MASDDTLQWIKRLPFTSATRVRSPSHVKLGYFTLTLPNTTDILRLLLSPVLTLTIEGLLLYWTSRRTIVLQIKAFSSR